MQRSPREKRSTARSHSRKTTQSTAPIIAQRDLDEQVRRALDSPTAANLTPEVIRELQHTRGNQFVQRLVDQAHNGQTAQPAITRTARPQVQRSIAPGRNLPDFKQINLDRQKMGKADEVRYLQEYVQDRMFMLAIFNKQYQQWQKFQKMGINKKAPTITDLNNVQDTIEAVLDGAPDSDTAYNTTAATLENWNKRHRSDMVNDFFMDGRAKAQKHWNDNVVKPMSGKIEETAMDRKTRKAFAKALMEMPTVDFILSSHKKKQAPSVNIGVAHWKDDGLLSDNDTFVVKDARPNKRMRDNNITSGETKKRINFADQFIRTIVQPDMLHEVNRPTINVYKENESTFRAYQSGKAVNVAQDDTASIIVHEIGHYLENNLPVEVWQDIATLIQHRHDQAGGGTQTVRGPSGMRQEGRFKGDYAATGGYTSKAYSGGQTELLSMSVEFLSDPKRAMKLILKDPQQAAVVLRALLPSEYRATKALRDFDGYLP